MLQQSFNISSGAMRETARKKTWWNVLDFLWEQKLCHEPTRIEGALETNEWKLSISTL